MIFELSIVNRHRYYGVGYIAGTADGIVTVNSQPTSRPVYLFESTKHSAPIFVSKIWSDNKGRYLFKHIDATKQYLVMCRDLPPNGTDQRYEPVAWDYVTPATDLTITEQQALWQSWQDDAISNTG